MKKITMYIRAIFFFMIYMRLAQAQITLDTTVTASADAYLDDANPATNYGSSNEIFVGPHGNDGTNDDFAGVVRFDLPPMLPGAVISTAVFDMQLFLDQSQVSTIYAYRITGPANWSEGTVTWNSNFTYDMKTSAGYLVTNGASQLYRFDIESILNSWYNSSNNNGFYIAAALNQGTANSYHTFWSRESGKPPSLMIVYKNNPVSLVSPADGASDLSSPISCEWNQLTKASSYRLQLSLDPSFATSLFDSAGIIGTTCVIGGLKGDTTYYWRVNAMNSYGKNQWSQVWSFHTAHITQIGMLRLLSPDGGETWIAGTTNQIKWALAGNMTSIDLQYTTNNGITWNPISSFPPTDTSYGLWIRPGLESKDCRVKVLGYYLGETAHDSSHSTFSIDSIQHEFFDDFTYSSIDDPSFSGVDWWNIQDMPSAPPVSNAIYDVANIGFENDPEAPSNKFIVLKSTSNGDYTSVKCSRVQTTSMMFREGTYAARVLFDDTQMVAKQGDVQAFYSISNYSVVPYAEMDFECLPWDVWSGVDKHASVLHLTSWATNSDRADYTVTPSFSDWHILTIQAIDGENVRYYVDSTLVATESNSTIGTKGLSVYPDANMQIAFANWIDTTQYMKSNKITPYVMSVDWVYHAAGIAVSPLDVQSIVNYYKSNNGLPRKNTMEIPSGIGKNDGEMPTVNNFALHQNYPNPFNPSTVISYDLPANGHVVLTIFDVLGREVKTLVSERQNAGSHFVTFNANNLPSGLYFYRIVAQLLADQKKDFVEVKKLMLVK